ncbi:hypothetical protein [Nitrosomonas sp. ANs5]
MVICAIDTLSSIVRDVWHGRERLHRFPEHADPKWVAANLAVFIQGYFMS